MKTQTLRCFCAGFLALISALPLHAQYAQLPVPSLINYQGRLTDAQGDPVTGNHTVTVKVYDAPTGGNLVYEESIGAVEVVDGIYSFQFGDDGYYSYRPDPDEEIYNSGLGIIGVLVGVQECHMALVVDGNEESTRSRLLAVPYALNAKQSETSADAQWLIKEQRRVEVYPETLDFGVLPGGNRTQTFSITNAGFRPIGIWWSDIDGEWSGAREAYQVEPRNGNILPGQSLNMTVTFDPGPDPQVRGDYNAWLTLQSDITAGPTTIQFQGAVVQPTVLSNNAAVTNLSGGEGPYSTWRFDVPWYATSLLFETSGGEGNVDLYLRYGDLPDWWNIDHSSENEGNDESILLENPTPGAWFAVLYGYNIYSGVSFLAKFEGDRTEMVAVFGGTLPQSSGLAGQMVGDFEIGKYEVTWDEWQEVRIWAVANGYSDLTDVGEGSAGDHPVRDVNWYDVVKWSNARSEKEGLTPVYQVEGQVYKTGQSEPTMNSAANGYRLPTEAEWDWAARGGLASQGYTYSGSNDVEAVAWYYSNSSGAAVNMSSGRGTWPVGHKEANELAIHDMSGNVWEWVFDSTAENKNVRGGSWNLDEVVCRVNVFGGNTNPLDRKNFIGFRLARSSGNMILIRSGILPQSSPLAGQQVATFLVGKYEVTWDEWKTVESWSAANGYDGLAGFGMGSAGNNPVHNVNLYNVTKWCNAKSEKEGFEPVYYANGEVYRTGEFGIFGSNAITVESSANGYRLPVEAEWEWAARGGVNSQGYTYSGSNDVNAVTWYSSNSGGVTNSVGTKLANELGIHDMSGNVREWVFDPIGPNFFRRSRGGGWHSTSSSCTVIFQQTSVSPDQRTYYGFRLARSLGN